jgi:predicted RNA binding protein YcfA (HicA-like mRNA interferase family)
MPRLKRLSGAEVVEILGEFGFEVHSQKGSHIKLRRSGVEQKETLTIPSHRQLDIGTCKAIFRQASKYIPEEQLFLFFYE